MRPVMKQSARLQTIDLMAMITPREVETEVITGVVAEIVVRTEVVSVLVPWKRAEVEEMMVLRTLVCRSVNRQIVA